MKNCTNDFFCMTSSHLLHLLHSIQILLQSTHLPDLREPNGMKTKKHSEKLALLQNLSFQEIPSQNIPPTIIRVIVRMSPILQNLIGAQIIE